MDWKQLLNPERPRRSTQDPDHREQFERDYDRALFSAPVRRLQDKTQVFPLDPNDSVRTRLTHSLEVSTLARGIATAAAKWLLAEGEIEPGMDRQIEAIAAACGLIHDLGNPPFGHAGEEAISGWFEDRFEKDKDLSVLGRATQFGQDFLKFQGNAQTLRLVTKLQVLADFNGLNLTFGTLSAALKYTARSDEAERNSTNHSLKKPGFFASENDIVTLIREKTGTGFFRNPITYLTEAADDLAYSIVDIEDAVTKRILTWNQIRDHLTSQLGDHDSVLQEVFDRTDRILQVPAGSRLIADVDRARAFRTAAISVGTKTVCDAFKSKYQDILTGQFTSSLVQVSNSAHLLEGCHKLGLEKIYPTRDNLKLEIMGRTIIQGLMSMFWEGARTFEDPASCKGFRKKFVDLLSENYRRVFLEAKMKHQELPLQYMRLQLVTDYVCGMTDTFARDLHRQLTNA